MTLHTRFARLIGIAVTGCAMIAVPGLAASGDTAHDAAKIVRVYSPEELIENPALLQDHPFGVVIGTVRAADTAKPIPNAMITLVTKSLVQDNRG